MYSVKKTTSIAYAHRLLNYNGKCENLHGHNGKVEVIIESESLNAEDMVEDFSLVERKLRKYLDENLDHKIILSEDDPLLKVLAGSGQRCYLVKKNPTAEVLAKLIFEAMKKEGMKVVKVNFLETESSTASYEEKGGR